MREIKFRGKSVENNEWVYGFFFLKDLVTPHIRDKYGKEIEVHLDSVGQYTGLKDKNGKEIYEGDIVKTKFWSKNEEVAKFIEKEFIGEVQYWGEYHGSYNLLDNTGGGIPIEWACHANDGWKIYGEIIGNVMENPGLLTHPTPISYE